ncbi:hypothetical protein BaRGS_00013118 [Batillaria attramentaria]|uniref:Thioesterase domain-containing protein n=1 Tax=Batillaria attramentaria TaxID=370345 RepID=A0ABD0L7Z5_9CAEN
MYDPQVSKWPLEVEVRPGHIGNTSLSTVSTITSPSDKQSGELYSQIAQVVLVDKVTRRPTPVADEWRRLYLPHCVRGEQPLIIPRQQVPTDGAASVYQVKVSWSDTDNYNHTNFASYPRFALDAIHDALSQGLLPESLSEKDIAAGVAEVKISYIGEAVEGDMLQVHVWCPEKTERTVVCSMNKEGQLINQVTLIFHSADTTCQL